MVINIKESYGIKDYIACGGAIFSILSNDITITNTTIQYNQCNGIAGAIYNNGPSLNINESEILNNLLVPYQTDQPDYPQQNGGGLYISPNLNTGGIPGISTTDINKTLIHNNIAVAYGGGIYNVSCTNTIIQNNASTNYAEQQDPNIKPVLTGGGCGITSMVGTVSVDKCIIKNNRSYGMYSSGIVGFSGDVSCLNTYIADNINAGPGGGIAVNLNCNLLINNSIISDNLGSGLGGAIINFSNNTFTTTITNSRITYNKLDNREDLLSAYQNIIGKINNGSS